jgi:hypothetical protein
LAEFGLIKGLQRIQIKKPSPFPTRVLSCTKNRSPHVSSGPSTDGPVNPVHGKTITQFHFFRNNMFLYSDSQRIVERRPIVA